MEESSKKHDLDFKRKGFLFYFHDKSHQSPMCGCDPLARENHLKYAAERFFFARSLINSQWFSQEIDRESFRLPEKAYRK